MESASCRHGAHSHCARHRANSDQQKQTARAGTAALPRAVASRFTKERTSLRITFRKWIIPEKSVGVFHRIQTAHGNQSFQQAAQGPGELVCEVARVSRAALAGAGPVQRTALTDDRAWNNEQRPPRTQQPEQQPHEGKVWLQTLRQTPRVDLTRQSTRNYSVISLHSLSEFEKPRRLKASSKTVFSRYFFGKVLIFSCLRQFYCAKIPSAFSST